MVLGFITTTAVSFLNTYVDDDKRIIDELDDNVCVCLIGTRELLRNEEDSLKIVG